ncbi:MAG TPA: alkaline phosphatase family protein [Candidatus Dormibacteraeota bacterium]|nr:alkaline phosphatase family protein [Candidatus Dormibacteraeota bacterium]
MQEFGGWRRAATGVCGDTTVACQEGEMTSSALRLAVAVSAVAAVAGCGGPTAQVAPLATAPPSLGTAAQAEVAPVSAPAPPVIAATAAPTSAPAAPPSVAPAPSARPPVAHAPITSSPARATVAAPPAPAAPHIMVIVMENREASSVLGQPDAPYINSLAATYGTATQWYGVGHPSLPNYLAMISGSDQGVRDDGTGYAFAGPTLVDELAARGIGWRAYMEDMPSPCFGGASSGGYAKKHDPFMYFTSITGNPAQCARVVPHTQLGTDLQSGTAPPFLFVTPNLCDDGHDCGNASADSWLRSEMQMVMASGWFQRRGSVVITWDEGGSSSGCCGDAAGGQIPTIVVTGGGRRRLDTPGDHYGMLRAIEEAYGVGLLGESANPGDGDLRTLLA